MIVNAQFCTLRLHIFRQLVDSPPLSPLDRGGESWSFDDFIDFIFSQYSIKYLRL